MKQIKHKKTGKVLYEYEEGKLNFTGANLEGADFTAEYLEGADFTGANLEGADFTGATLEGADFTGATLEGADLSHASMIFAQLAWACMGNAVLIGTDFTDADLRQCQFWGADMKGASMRDAVIYGANLKDAVNVPYIPMVCPETGSFTAWKKVEVYSVFHMYCKTYIVELEIPADAERSSATTRKCRASKALVKSISRLEYGKVTACPERLIVNKAYGLATFYEVGKMVYPNGFDGNRWNECSNGIHFFINKQDAIDYGL